MRAAQANPNLVRRLPVSVRTARGGKERRAGTEEKGGGRTVQRVVNESEMENGRGGKFQFHQGKIAYGRIGHFQIAQRGVGTYVFFSPSCVSPDMI